MSEETSIFLDKITVSTYVLNQEANLTEAYNELLIKRSKGYESEKTLARAHFFLKCIYDFLEVEITKRKNAKLPKIIERYVKDGFLNFKDLTEAYNLLRFHIQRNGYHNTKTESRPTGMDEYLKRYNVKT